MSPVRACRSRPGRGSGPGTGRTVAAGLVRSVVSCSCGLSPFLMVDRLDEPGLDELAECGFGDAHVSADPDEPDTALFDQPPGEALGGAEHVGGLGDGQQPVSSGGLVAPCHAARPVAERSRAGWPLVLALARAS